MKTITTTILLALALVVMLTAWRPVQSDELAKSKARGKVLYEELCVACHMADGTGMEGVFPPLAKADYLLKTPAKAIHAVKFGQEGEVTVNGVVYNNMMPAPGLSDQEVADVMNYILNSWGNKGKFVSVEDVKKVKE